MVVELSAVRVLAPRFGDSVPVWTNVIGVILAALAVGAMLGGYLADRGRGPRVLPAMLMLSGGVVACAPWLAPHIGDWILPESLTLDRAMPILVGGSLATTVLVFAPPIFFLGAVSPMLIQSASASHGELVGRVAGAIYAAGTIGSLAGTFAATHVLVPSLGLRGTFLVAATALALASILGFVAMRRTFSVATLVLLLPMATLLLPEPPPRWLGDGLLVEKRDGAYQRLWVVGREENVKGGKRPARVLAINEGLDSYHSIRIEGMDGANGRYYDAFGLLAPLVRARATDHAPRVLSLGCAAGTIVRVLARALPADTKFVGVDLDPAVIELGQKWFDLPRDDPRFEFIGGLDARVYVDRVDRETVRFDLICVDTYRNQIYLPVHLSSREFFVSVKRRLAPNGLVALNVGDLPGGGPLLEAVAGTLATVFRSVESFAIPGSRNFLVIAHEGETRAVPRVLARTARPDAAPEAIWTRARRSGAWRVHAALPDEKVLVDDRSSLDTLHEALYGRLHVRPPADRGDS